MTFGSQRQRGPSFAAGLLLFIGIWASLATSSPTTDSETFGQFVIEPTDPSVVVSVVAKAPVELHYGSVRLNWMTTTASGEQPQLSVTVAGEDVDGVSWFNEGGMGAPIPTTPVPLRIAVLNAQETGAVTFDWTFHTSIDRDADLKTRVEATPSAAPNPRVALPMPGTPSSPVSVVRIEATVPNDTLSPGVQIDLRETRADGRRLAGAVVDNQGELSDLAATGAVIPWPDSCSGELCRVAVDLVVYGPAIFPIADTLDPAGKVTAYRPQVVDTTAQISLPVSSQQPGSSSFVVTMGDNNDILNSYVTLSVSEQSLDADGKPSSCLIDVNYSINGEPSTRAQDLGSPPRRLQPGVASTMDFTRAAEQPVCGPQPQSTTGFEVTARTFGLESPIPARLSQP